MEQGRGEGGLHGGRDELQATADVRPVRVVTTRHARDRFRQRIAGVPLTESQAHDQIERVVYLGERNEDWRHDHSYYNARVMADGFARTSATEFYVRHGVVACVVRDVSDRSHGPIDVVVTVYDDFRDKWTARRRAGRERSQ